MIKIKKPIEVIYYLEEDALRAFADRNGYDEEELNEAIENDELDVEWLCSFHDEIIIDYTVERD